MFHIQPMSSKPIKQIFYLCFYSCLQTWIWIIKNKKNIVFQKERGPIFFFNTSCEHMGFYVSFKMPLITKHYKLYIHNIIIDFTFKQHPTHYLKLIFKCFKQKPKPKILSNWFLIWISLHPNEWKMNNLPWLPWFPKHQTNLMGHKL